jgi:hypothetical protein
VTNLALQKFGTTYVYTTYIAPNSAQNHNLARLHSAGYRLLNLNLKFGFQTRDHVPFKVNFCVKLLIYTTRSLVKYLAVFSCTFLIGVIVIMSLHFGHGFFRSMYRLDIHIDTQFFVGTNFVREHL